MNPFDNIILLTDSYKVSHHLQTPPGTEKIYSYFESRGGKFDKTLFFGLQYILKKWLVGPVITKEKIKDAKNVCSEHFGQELFNESGWLYIVENYKGYLPLKIKAIPEGSVIPTRNVLFTVENTDPKLAWLTNWFEGLLLQCWYPTTVATISFFQKMLLAQYLRETADNMNALIYQLHDFGFRGCTSVETSAIGSAANLVNFYSTDTLPGLMFVKHYYNSEDIPGISIPATEHSTMTIWGSDVNSELNACKHMLETFPKGKVAVVSDSYDIFNCCKNIWGKQLKAEVIKRGETSGSMLVIRPDSGDPAEVVLEVLRILESEFPVTINTKKYKMLPNYLRIIQGDGISYDSLAIILKEIKEAGWSTENLIFGSGGALLQRMDRDTQKCAYKTSYAEVNGKQMSVFKNPVTDPGKTSKKGRLTLEKVKNKLDDGYTFKTKEEGEGIPEDDLLVTIFENGCLLQEYTFAEIRRTAESHL